MLLSLSHRLPSLLLGAALCLGSGAWAAGQTEPPLTNKQDYSQAERLIFMTPQLQGLRPPLSLRYTLRKAGTYEPGFEDSVAVLLSAGPKGSCCNARAEFLSGERRLTLPEVEGAEANPVQMYFLEHDVREMHRLTKGSQNHFRKRIRMAIYADAKVSDVKLPYRGREIEGKLVVFSPYLDDPNRSRFEKLARKEYRFLLAAAVPGGVYAIRTQIADPTPGAAPLITEELLAEGAQSLSP